MMCIILPWRWIISNIQPDILSVHVLTEVLHASFISDSASMCLEVLDRHSVITMAMAQLEEDLHRTSDLGYILVVFNMLITTATTKAVSNTSKFTYEGVVNIQT